MTDAGRPQDQGRSHRKAGRPSAATVSLLAEWQETLRAELRVVIDELRGTVEPGLGLVEPVRKRPNLSDRARLLDIGIKAGRELGTEVDRPAPTPHPIATSKRGGPRRGKVDMG